MSEASDAINKFRGQVEPARPVLTGWMVDHEGTGSPKITGRPGYIYVLIDRGEAQSSGDVVEVWCRFRPVAGWPVRIGTTRDRPWEYSVLSIDDEAMGGTIDGKPILEHHSEMHQWCDPSGGDDVVYPRFLQLYDFAVWPGGGLSVNVQDGIYEPYCVTRGLSYTNLDLTAYKPPSGLRYVTIALSPTGTFEIVPGAIQSTFLDLDDIPPAPSAEHWRLAAVRVRSTDTEIVNTCTQTNIVDLRFARLGWPITLTDDADANLLGFDNCHRLDLDTQPSGQFFAANPSAASKPYFRHIELSDLPPFVNPDWENVIVVAKSGGDYTTIPDAHAAASANDAILIMPGTYANDVVISKDITLVGLSKHEVIVTGEIDCTSACKLQNFTVQVSKSSAGNVIGVDIDQGSTYVDNLHVDVTNSGTGNAYGIRATHAGGSSRVSRCYSKGDATGGGDGYGVYTDIGLLTVEFCYLDGSTQDLGSGGILSAASAHNVFANDTMSGNVMVMGEATTASSGTVELATNAETQTGTSTSLAVTPAGLRADVPATPAANRGVRLDAGADLDMPGGGNIILSDTGDVYTLGDEGGMGERRDGYQPNIDDHFDGSSLSAPWAWAGAPFVTPPTVDFSVNSLLRAGNFALAADRGFLYQSFNTSHSYVRAAVGLLTTALNFACGVRLDDGSDNNYVEAVLYLQAASPDVWRVQRRHRVGGGAVTTADGSDLVVPLPYIASIQITGTKWANWAAYARLESMFSIGGLMFQTGAAAGLTWTPSRVGLIFDQGGTATAAWHRGVADFFKVSP